MRRVVVTGSEGTGKTTLTRRLAEHFRAPWVAEYAREYAGAVHRSLGVDDVAPIARGQIALEDAVLREQPALVFLDTDLVSTLVYARHYYGTEPDWLVSAARDRLADLYLLVDIDLPWQPDGIRDQPHARAGIQALFRQTLHILGAQFTDIRGSNDARFDAAREIVEDFIAAPPNGYRKETGSDPRV